MKALFSMTRRNLLLFFRDRAAVFFSLMSVLIIIGLYVFFLGDMMVRSMDSAFGAQSRFIMDSWIMAGMIAVASITTTMGAYGNMVDDRSRKILKDFYTTPVQRATLSGGYLISALIIGLIMCLLNLVLAEVYIVAMGGSLLSARQMLQVLGVILLAVVSNSALVLFITSFFHTAGAFGAASTVLGTMIGFLTGIYIPIGSLPEAVQWVIKCFPPSHAAALMRQVMMGETLSMAPAPIRTVVEVELGVRFGYGGYLSTPLLSILVLAASGILFYVLAGWQLSRKRAK